MNEEFITEGIEKDRYLKATRLADRFETEIRRELERIGDEIVKENREQFVEGSEASWNNLRSPNSVIAFARVDYDMDRVRSQEDPQGLTLNISFRWLEPDEYGHPNVDGALTVTSYKIKSARKEDHERVKRETMEEDWDIQFCEDAFGNSPGVAYIPVQDAEDIKQAHEDLKSHFSEYCTMFGVQSE